MAAPLPFTKFQTSLVLSRTPRPLLYLSASALMYCSWIQSRSLVHCRQTLSFQRAVSLSRRPNPYSGSITTLPHCVQRQLHLRRLRRHCCLHRPHRRCLWHRDSRHSPRIHCALLLNFRTMSFRIRPLHLRLHLHRRLHRHIPRTALISTRPHPHHRRRTRTTRRSRSRRRPRPRHCLATAPRCRCRRCPRSRRLRRRDRTPRPHCSRPCRCVCRHDMLPQLFLVLCSILASTHFSETFHANLRIRTTLVCMSGSVCFTFIHAKLISIIFPPHRPRHTETRCFIYCRRRESIRSLACRRVYMAASHFSAVRYAFILFVQISEIHFSCQSSSSHPCPVHVVC
jgi:hypothetical protein